WPGVDRTSPIRIGTSPDTSRHALLLPADSSYVDNRAAAEDLCLTRSAVSRQVQELKRALGVTLFTRGHRVAGRFGYLVCAALMAAMQNPRLSPSYGYSNTSLAVSDAIYVHRGSR